MYRVIKYKKERNRNAVVRLIVSDVDGTLVSDGSADINTEIYDVILKLKEKGIFFAVASGRQYASVKKLFRPIEDQIIIIAENGAYIVCLSLIHI